MIPVSMTRQAMRDVFESLHPLSRRLQLLSPHPPFSPETAQPVAGRSLAARGTFAYPVKNVPIQMGETGVSVTLSDLNLTHDETTVLADGFRYDLPAHSPAGMATLTGTDYADTLATVQDRDGNTVVKVASQGNQASLNLGRIASLNIAGQGGDDRVTVQGDDYFGGVNLEGGDGDDSLTAILETALRRGATLRGDAGNDILSVDERHSAALLDGGSGTDRLILTSHQAARNLLRRAYGQDGDDYLQGGIGADTLSGGAGNDHIFGLGGSDRLDGGAGNDQLDGGRDDDLLLGGTGADLLMGRSGNDWLDGGPGNDLLYGGSGVDALKGGADADMLAPNAKSPLDILAYSKVGSRLKVLLRNEPRSQSIIRQWKDRNKLLLDYAPDSDYLADARRVV